jgi:hypothetical protein
MSASVAFTISRGWGIVVVAGVLISTVGGNGSIGLTGAGGLAALGSMNTPEGIAVDSNGNIYFADTDNDWIRTIKQ